MVKRRIVGRPRISPLTRAEQLRVAKRAQRERQRAAGIRPVEIALDERQAARFRAAVASPRFRQEFDRLLGEMAVDRTAWPVLNEITWNRVDRWIPADEALALYERNWRHVDTALIGDDEARLIRRLADRFGGGVFNG